MVHRVITPITFLILILLFAGCGDNSTGPDPKDNYQVSINASPSDGGTVSPSGGQYEEGQSIEISATPSEGWRFVEWTGDYSGQSSMATITVNSDMNIEANFTKKEYALTINTKGEGTIDEEVLQTKSTNYPYGTVVELTANPSNGWEFFEWQGELSSSESPEQITVDKPKEVTAIFKSTTPGPETAFPGQTGEITDITINGVELTVEKFGDVYIYQGDIIINPDDYNNSKYKKGVNTNSSENFWDKYWANNTLPYMFDKGVSEKFEDLISQGIEMIEANTNVKVEKRNNQKNHVVFVEMPIPDNGGIGGSSYIGNRRMGRQDIKVTPNASAGVVAHEIMHALGLLHEQSRADRGFYVKIISENIQDDKLHNFEKTHSYNPIAPYDYQSIMHYSSYGWKKDGLTPKEDYPTLTKLDGSEIDRNRDHITQNDIYKINELYPDEDLKEPATIISAKTTPNPSTQHESVKFSAEIAGDEPIICKWSIGNGFTKNSCETFYSYQNVGTYDVTLEILNDGGSDSATFSHEIKSKKPPTIKSASSKPHPSNTGETVNFSADISGDEPIDCEWNFGNGATSTECNTTYTYQSTGTYEVSLKAINGGGTDTATLTHEVVQSGEEYTIYVSSVDYSSLLGASDPSYLYSVDISPQGKDNRLGQIKTNDGEEPAITDIASGESDELWGVSYEELYQINSKTAEAKYIGDTDFNGINALELDADGRLLGLTIDGELIQIDKQTGSSTIITELQDDWGSIGDITFGPDAVLFGIIGKDSDQNFLAIIDVNSGDVTPVNPGTDIGYENVFGLTYFADTFYAVTTTNNPDGGFLLEIDLSTGKGSIIRELDFHASGAGKAN